MTSDSPGSAGTDHGTNPDDHRTNRDDLRDPGEEGVPPGTVVVGVDGSESAERALVWAAVQAHVEHRALTLVHGLGPLGTSGTAWLDQAGVNRQDLLDAMRTDGRALLDAARARVEQTAPGVRVHEVLRMVDPRAALLDLAPEATMLVLGSRGRGPIRSLVLGSVSAGVSRHAVCPVVISRPPRPVEEERRGVLVGADASGRGSDALELAYRLASSRRLPLTVMHCFWDARGMSSGSRLVSEAEAGLEQERMLLAEAVGGMTEKFPDVVVRLQLARGLADECLVRASRHMDVVVVGYHRLGPVAGVVHGSVATSVLEHAGCMVAVVPEPGGGRRP